MREAAEWLPDSEHVQSRGPLHGLQGQGNPARGLPAGRRSRPCGDQTRELQLPWDRPEKVREHLLYENY